MAGSMCNDITAFLQEKDLHTVICLPGSEYARLLKDFLIPANGFQTFIVSREEEGFAIAAGLSVAGKGCVTLFQNTGFLNSLTGLLELSLEYKIPYLNLLSLRGVGREPNRAHVRVGSATMAVVREVLQAPHAVVRQPDEIRAGLDAAWNAMRETRLPSFTLIECWQALLD